jgi:hypothetical protein
MPSWPAASLNIALCDAQINRPIAARDSARPLSLPAAMIALSDRLENRKS